MWCINLYGKYYFLVGSCNYLLYHSTATMLVCRGMLAGAAPGPFRTFNWVSLHAFSAILALVLSYIAFFLCNFSFHMQVLVCWFSCPFLIGAILEVFLGVARFFMHICLLIQRGELSRIPLVGWWLSVNCPVFTTNKLLLFLIILVRNIGLNSLIIQLLGHVM